jgi:hypothetical protein
VLIKYKHNSFQSRDITGSLPDGQTSQSFQYKFTPSADLNTMTAIRQLSERTYINEKRGKGYPDKMVFKREQLN